MSDNSEHASDRQIKRRNDRAGAKGGMDISLTKLTLASLK